MRLCYGFKRFSAFAGRGRFQRRVGGLTFRLSTDRGRFGSLTGLRGRHGSIVTTSPLSSSSEELRFSQFVIIDRTEFSSFCIARSIGIHFRSGRGVARGEKTAYEYIN